VDRCETKTEEKRDDRRISVRTGFKDATGSGTGTTSINDNLGLGMLHGRTVALGNTTLSRIILTRERCDGETTILMMIGFMILIAQERRAGSSVEPKHVDKLSLIIHV
jgi:hypothetical protein